MGSSGLPLVSLQAGCEHCFTTAVLRCCFLLWHLALNSQVSLPIQLLFVLQEPLWTVFPGRGTVLQNFSLSPHCIHSLSILSSKYGFVELWCGLCCVSSDALPKSNLSFVTPLHALWRDVFNPLILVPQHLFTSEVLRFWCKHGVVMRCGFSAHGEFMVSWAIGDGRGACSVDDHFFCLLVVELLEFLCFSKIEVVRYFFRSVVGGLWMEKLSFWLQIALYQLALP